MHETIKRLREERAKLWEQAKALLDAAESEDRSLTGEEEQTYERLTAEIDELGERVKRMEELVAREQAAAEVRNEAVARPNERTQGDRQVEDDLRRFLKGEVRSLTFDLRDARVVVDHRSGRYEVRDLLKGAAATGGATVPTGFIPRLMEHLVEESGIRRTNAEVITTDSGEDLPFPRTTSHGSAALVAEGAAIPENDPAFTQVVLKAYKFGTLVQVSSELIADTAVDLLGYVARASGISLGQAIGQYFVTGTGTNQPEGVQPGAAVGKQGAAGQTTTVTGDDLIDLYHSLVSGYRGRGFWFMLDATLAKVRKLKDAQNQYIWQPGLQAGIPDSLLGRPVITDPNMPAMAANAKSILFGDFSRYYVIRDVATLRFDRSDEYAFGNDLVTFRALIRTDGRVADPNAVKAYQNSAT